MASQTEAVADADAAADTPADATAAESPFITMLLSQTKTSTSRSSIVTKNKMVNNTTKPTLGSFPRSVGPAADIRELEYISALHQNAEAFLRLDGTICCT